MFVQVIQGRVDDPKVLQAAIEQWIAEVSPGAIGWLGSTGGVTDDGRFIAVIRFQDADTARRNGERPEQDQWWKETSALFTDEPQFTDSEDVTVDGPGDPAKATFVQVMRGTGRDPGRAKQLMAQMSQDPAAMAAFRPDILGSVSATTDGGTGWTMVNYFTSEADAREGEKKEAPPEMAGPMAELGSLMTSEPVFFDLRDPWMHAPS
jgi:hypothetical protein